jgi:hypothetical protein
MTLLDRLNTMRTAMDRPITRPDEPPFPLVERS